jgi:hypothetical protein
MLRPRELVEIAVKGLSKSQPLEAPWMQRLTSPTFECTSVLCTMWESVTSLGPIASVTEIIGNLAGFLYARYFVASVASVYFLSPTLFGDIGGWNGRNASDICSALTNVQASFWDTNPDQCHELIQNRFIGVLTLAQATLAMLCTYRMLSGLFGMLMGACGLCRCCWCRWARPRSAGGGRIPPGSPG